MTNRPSERDPAPARDARGQEIRRFTSEELFLSARRLEILHQGERYRLQITRHGKLILTK